MEIMSVLDHATPKEGAIYTKKANPGKLADDGLQRAAEPKAEQNVSNLPARLDKPNSQRAEIKGKQ